MVEGMTNWMDMNLSKLWELITDRDAWHPWGHKDSDTTEQLNRTVLSQLIKAGSSFTYLAL